MHSSGDSLGSRRLLRRRIGLISMVMLFAGHGIASESAKNRIPRLGFTFDQRAHDAAKLTTKAAADDGEFGGPTPLGVVRLPKYHVTEDRIRLEEREMLTPEGRVEVAKKRYLAPMYQKTIAQVEAVATFLANPLGGWAPNGPEAMAIYNDFEQKRRNGEMSDLVELARLADRTKVRTRK